MHADTNLLATSHSTTHAAANAVRVKVGSRNQPKDGWCAVQALPQRRQTLLFTATVTGAVQELQDHILKSPCVFKQYTGLRTASNLREQHVRMQAHVKELYLMYVLQRLKEFKVRSGMIFCGTKDTCEFIGSLLYHLKQSAVTLHSGKKQKARLGALNKVRRLPEFEQLCCLTSVVLLDLRTRSFGQLI